MNEPFTTLARGALVAALTAAAAGGIYLVASTTEEPSGEHAAGVVETAIPTLTPTPAVAAEGTSTPTSSTAETPTPPPSLEPMRIDGFVWLNARPAFTLVEAFIGDVKCAEFVAAGFPDEYQATYTLTIPTEGDLRGCGAPGRVVTFLVEGRIANETVTFEPASSVVLELTAGPPFARYTGTFTYPDLPPTGEIQPLIDGGICGQQLNDLRGSGPTFYYEVVVDPEELSPGCGRTGASVSFRLIARNDKDFEVLTGLPGAEPWRAGVTARTAQ